MPRKPRVLYPNALYHVFNRGVEKRPIFLDDRDRKTFLKVLGGAIEEFHFTLFAYCLMSNHYHLFLRTLLANLDKGMQSFQSQYAHYLNLRYTRVGPLFQGRYQSRLVESDSYIPALTRYIHRNPLEASLVSRLEDYAWSSYPSYLGISPKWNWLETDWVLCQFHEQRLNARRLFQEFHEKDPDNDVSRMIQNITPKRGRPRKGV